MSDGQTPDPHAALIADGHGWVQEEDWATDYGKDGTRQPGTDLIAHLTRALVQEKARADRLAAIIQEARHNTKAGHVPLILAQAEKEGLL